MTSNTTARHFVFTSHAKTEPIYDSDKMRYLVYQLELCPTTKTPHWQGYVELHQSLRPTTVKKLLGGNPHVEYRRGTRDDARNYCMKEETRAEPPVEHGQWVKNQGKRTDLDQIYELIKNGSSDLTLLDQFPSQVIRYGRGIKSAKFISNAATHSKLRRKNLIVKCYWGPPGCGKTRKAWDEEGHSLFSLTKGNGSTVWFDGYDGEDCLLLDDFYGWIPYGYLLQLLDIYPVRLEIKGGHCWAAWTRIIITSNKQPSEWYNRSECDALLRRITTIEQFEKKEESEEKDDD